MELSKAELRKIYLERRKALSDTEVALLSDKIIKNIMKYFDWEKIQNIHTFLPMNSQKEVDVWGLIRWIFSEWNDKNIFIPKINKNELQTCILTPNTILESNQWGILEPVEEAITENINYDIIITPLLYVDFQGNRIGYGKGYYDKFFAKINSDAIKVGVSFFPPNETILDVSKNDVPLDYLVTPEEIVSFSFKSKSIK